MLNGSCEHYAFGISSTHSYRDHQSHWPMCCMPECNNSIKKKKKNNSVTKTRVTPTQAVFINKQKQNYTPTRVRLTEYHNVHA